MKQYSPIIFFFILLLYSCNQNTFLFNKESTISDTVNSHIEKSQRLPTEKERLLESKKALSIARKSKEDSLIYKAFYNKIWTDITLHQENNLDYNLEKLKGISKTIYEQAGYHYLRGYYFQGKNIDSSFANYLKSEAQYLSVGKKAKAGYSLIMISEIQRAAGDYVEAEGSLTKAYQYLKDLKKYNLTIYNSFGLIYMSQKNYEKALEYYLKALEITNGSQARNVIQNNIALIYRDQKDYEKSTSILDSLNSLPSLNSDPIMKAKVLSNLGYSIFLSKKGDELSYLKQAEVIQDTIDDSFGRLANYLISAEAYGEKDKTISKSYALKAYVLSKELNNGEEKLRSLELMSKATNNKLETDKIFLEYITLNDSINTALQNKKNGFAKIKYDSSEAEKNALQSKLVAEKAEANNILLLVVVGFLAVLAIVVYYFMKRKSAINQVKASYATELRISKKVHDELANDIYNIMMYSGAQDLASEEKKERLLGDLDSVYKRTRDISKENATIETGENYPQQLMGMLSEYQNEKVNVLNSGIKEIAWEKVEEIKKIAVYRILQELMVNMAKHSQASVCVVTFKSKGKNIIISYSDTGVGIGSDKIIFKNGLANAENRIKGIGGSLTFDSNPEKGLKMTIVFPA